MRVLLVEDDTLLGDGLMTLFAQQDIDADWLKDGASVIDSVAAHRYEVLILDLNLPAVSGLDILKTLRQRGETIPVLVLTARSDVTDRVKALDEGADDYVLKPFEVDELFARIRALHRRRYGTLSTKIMLGDIVLDTVACTVSRGGEPVELSHREFGVLQQLMDNPGRVMTRQRLEQHIYGWNVQVESNAIEVHVHHLRKKLGNDLIRTVRGVGYVIERTG